jgi:protein-tyrosine phosphatase
MISSIKIYNRFNMDCFRWTNGLNFPFKRWYLISIHNDEEDVLLNKEAVNFYKLLGMVDYLDLKFWDLDKKNYNKIKLKYSDASLFNEKKAKAIIKFLSNIKLDLLEANLVIHCHAGISRSGAVGTFACEYLQLSYLEFIKENPYILANQYVLDILKKVSGIYINRDYYRATWTNNKIITEGGKTF